MFGKTNPGELSALFTVFVGLVDKRWDSVANDDCGSMQCQYVVVVIILEGLKWYYKCCCC